MGIFLLWIPSPVTRLTSTESMCHLYWPIFYWQQGNNFYEVLVCIILFVFLVSVWVSSEWPKNIDLNSITHKSLRKIFKNKTRYCVVGSCYRGATYLFSDSDIMRCAMLYTAARGRDTRGLPPGMKLWPTMFRNNITGTRRLISSIHLSMSKNI